MIQKKKDIIKSLAIHNKDVGSTEIQIGLLTDKISKLSDHFKKFKKGISIKNSNRKVVVYSTCFVNFNKKNTGVAALKVLEKNGVDVKHSYAGCCGMPYLEQAAPKKVVNQAKKVSKELLNWIDKGYEIITLTASCGLMLKFEWPLLLPDDPGIKKLSKNTKDIDEYIVDISNKEMCLGWDGKSNKIPGKIAVCSRCIEARGKWYNTNTNCMWKKK